mmetsp:Transcript_23669/g.68442  ORF Transcript_23669/g.68442 Transcript_23669/m.68442 type:complete len:221 (+) Transcript_23669:753-1415(+)
MDAHVEVVCICQRDDLAVRGNDLPVVAKLQSHDPLRLQVGVRLDERRGPADGVHLCGVVVAAEDEVDALAQLSGQLAILPGELMRQREDDVALLLLPEVLHLLLRRLDDVLVMHLLLVLEHRLTDIVGGAKHAHFGGLLLRAPDGREGDLLDDMFLGALQQLVLLVEQIDVQPRKLGLLDALAERLDSKIELVVAERGGVQVQVIQDIDHLGPLEHVAQR